MSNIGGYFNCNNRCGTAILLLEYIEENGHHLFKIPPFMKNFFARNRLHLQMGRYGFVV